MKLVAVVVILTAFAHATPNTDQVCPFDHGRLAGHSRLLCELWRKVKVATAEEEETEEAASVMHDEDVPREIYRIPTKKELEELMHVDDASDEERDKEKMKYVEIQEEALRKMHIANILSREEELNKLRDFAPDIEVGGFDVRNNLIVHHLPRLAQQENSFAVQEMMRPTTLYREPIMIDPQYW